MYIILTDILCRMLKKTYKVRKALCSFLVKIKTQSLLLIISHNIHSCAINFILFIKLESELYNTNTY